MSEEKKSSNIFERIHRGITPVESMIVRYSLELISAEELCNTLSFLSTKEIIKSFFEFRQKYSKRVIMDEELTEAASLSDRLDKLLDRVRCIRKEEKDALNLYNKLKSKGITGHLAISEIFPRDRYIPEDGEEELAEEKEDTIEHLEDK